MVNEAVAEYIKKSTAQVEAEMGSVLTQLKAYRRADATFQQDKDAFVSAEAEFGASDPMEGFTYKVVRHRSPMSPKASAPKEKAGAALTMVGDMLRSTAVASGPPTDWGADSQISRSNLARVEDRIRADVEARVKPDSAAARARHVAMMKGLKVPNPLFVGRFRGEADLEDLGVRVGPLEGTHPDLVAPVLGIHRRTMRACVKAYADADRAGED
jgi:hypothetical protein